MSETARVVGGPPDDACQRSAAGGSGRRACDRRLAFWESLWL